MPVAAVMLAGKPKVNCGSSIAISGKITGDTTPIFVVFPVVTIATGVASEPVPAVVGIGPFLADVSGGEPVILDGNQGVVILQPDEETIARYRLEAEVAETVAASLGQLRDLPAETTDD